MTHQKCSRYHHILIQHGAKLIGDYDNTVTTGQERALVVWTRVIYPDASPIDLGKVPGTHTAGYVGFHDKVDNHFWSKFSDAVLLPARRSSKVGKQMIQMA